MKTWTHLIALTSFTICIPVFTGTIHGATPEGQIGMSRGGEYAYRWATTNPDKVSCIYADNPGGNRDILMKLGDLAVNDVPLLHVCGSIDALLGRFSSTIESIYQQWGGRITVIVKEGEGHFPTAPRDAKPVVDFITARSQ